MRTLLTLLVALVTLSCAEAAAAQDQPDGAGRIAGRVVDAENDEPLQGATVAVRQPSEDSTLVTGTTTDEMGRFTVDDVPLGRYVVRISFVGFTTETIDDVRLDEDGAEQDLGTIRLRPDTEQLDEVEVSGERPAMEVQDDRTVYNTAEQVVSAGGTATDVLEALPSIEIDIDGNISYRGNQSVAIHINGRPSSLEGDALTSFLRSLSADDVERVEMIPNPSARYEPDGMAGILNIVLKENREAGWNGGLTLGGGMPTALNGSANAGYRSNAWTLFANYGFRYSEDTGSGERFRENRMANPTTLLNQSNTEDDTRRSHVLNTQAEYRLAEATSLSLESVFSTRTSREDGRTNYVERTDGGALTDRYARLIETQDTDYDLDARLAFQHDVVPEEHTLSAELRYDIDWEYEDGAYAQHDLTADGDLDALRSRERDDLSEIEGEGSLQIDYQRPLGRFDLETGYKGDLRHLDSDELFETFDPEASAFRTERTNAFAFDERIHAGYGILSTGFGLFSVQAGLRAEQALTTFTLESTGENYDNNYFSLFPSAFVLFKPTEAQQVRLSYSKRIDRPNLWEINPLDDNEDPNFRRLGNPSLDPEYVHAFELSATRHWEHFTLTASPFFRRTVNEISRRETIDEDGVTTLRFDNFESSNSYGAEFVVSLNVERWLRGNVTLNTYRVVTDASNVDAHYSNDAMAYSTRANLTFKVNETLDLQVSQYYRAPMNIAGGRMGGRTRSDVALRQRLLDGNAQLSVRARDVFDTMNFDIYRQTDTFYTESSRDWNAQQVRVSFTYNFGGGDAPNERRRGRRR